MRSYLIYLSLILFSVSLNGQIVGYKISEYKYQDVKRIFLEVSPDIGVNRLNDFTDRNLIGDAGLFVRFNNRFYTEKIQMINSAIVNPSFTISELNNTRERITNRLLFSYNANIYYYPRGKWFVGGTTNSFGFYAKTTYEEDLRSTRSFRTDTTPTIGYGRIELVTDMWHAGTILKILEAKGLLLQTINRGDIEAFAKVISEAKNIRNLDLRLENIDELELVFDYLIEEGICKDESISAFLLKDAYEFEAFINREHGRRVALFTEYQFNSRKTFDNTIEDFFSQGKDYGIGLSYENNKAISQLIQLDHFYKLTLMKNSTINFDIEDKANYLEFFMSHSLGLYLSQRTYFNTGLSITYDDWVGKRPSSSGLAGSYFSVTGSWAAFYYLSSSIRFSASYQIRYKDSNIEGLDLNNGVYSNFNLGFQYFIF